MPAGGGPAELLGRVAALAWMLSLALSPLGTIAGGAAASVVGVRMTLVMGSAIAIAAAGVALVPKVREPDRRQVLAVADADAEAAV